MGKSLFDRIFGEYAGQEPEFAAKVEALRERNDIFGNCPDGQCTPGARGQQLTGWNSDSDRAMGQLRDEQQLQGEGRTFGRSALEGMSVTQEQIDARFPDNRRAGKVDNVESPVRVDNWPVKVKR